MCATAFFLMEMGISIREERCGKQLIAASGDQGVLQGPAAARVNALVGASRELAVRSDNSR
jgi:hypothetical protein